MYINSVLFSEDPLRKCACSGPYFGEKIGQPDRLELAAGFLSKGRKSDRIFRIFRIFLVAFMPSFVPVFAQDPSDSESTPELSYLWWEAENFSSSSGTSKETNDVLSNAVWVTMDEVPAGQPRFLVYDSIEIPESGTYHLYARKFWRHGPYQWQFEGTNQSGTVAAQVAILDSVELRTNRVVNWTYAGEAVLEAGTFSLQIDLLNPDGAAAFDAFVLTQEPFPFRGKYQPEEQIQADEPGWFSWTNTVDPYTESAIDLRYLNDKIAGEQGFVQASGENFVFGGSNEAVRFWGVNATSEVVSMDALSADRYARDLAKYGVNLVRIHTPLFDQNDPKMQQLDPQLLDRLFYLISALKKEGIYVSLSLYFPLWLELGPDDPRFPGYEGTNPFAAIFFHPALQELYRGWWRQLLMTPNPYTGVALKDEPAIFALELVNEDSLLFWTSSNRNIPAESLQILESRFAVWLVDTFGSLSLVAKRWQGFWGRLGGGFDKNLDHPDEQRIGFISLYDIIHKKTQRAKDTARFLTETQTQFYRQHRDFLKQELGFGGMVSASNWITADDQILGPLDKVSNSVGDFIDQHGYFNSSHTDSGDGSSKYSLRIGHSYRDRSALLFSDSDGNAGKDFSNPIWNIVYNNKPSIISEVNWPMPNRFRADMPFLLSGFSRLQGVDAVILFTSQPTPWEMQFSKFSIYSPLIKSQWPAAALAFRKGYIQESPVVAEVNLPLEGLLYELQGSPLITAANPDSLRSGTTAADNPEDTRPPASVAGKAKVNFSQSAQFSETNQTVTAKFDEQSFTSATQELFWNYGIGYSTINTPKIQGAAGFLNRAGEISLEDLTISAKMEYGSVWLISLDDLPLASSVKMLLLVASEEKTSGWQTSQSEGLKTIISLGKAPFLIREMAGQVELSRPDANELEVEILDQAGYRLRPYSKATTILFGTNISYYLIEKGDRINIAD